MQSFYYPHFPEDLSVVHIALLDNVRNAAALRTRLIQAASLPGPEGDIERGAVNFAFVDARLICSIQHLRTAVYHTLLAAVQGSLRTKTIHSEIIWTLNPTNNITEALRRYGVSEDTKSLFVVRVSGPSGDFAPKISEAVDGTVVPLDSIKNITDWSTIKKYYKLNNEPCIRNAAGNISVEHAKIDTIVTSSVATKTVMT
ncbi:CGI-121-domain-containing protein [Trametopsis cervina]|nr:CGI-121-domain-containing protein [Trametopsis cervina]